MCNFKTIPASLCVICVGVVSACARTGGETPFDGFHYTATRGSDQRPKQFGLSGIAPAGNGNFLAAVDLKNKGKKRRLPRFLLIRPRGDSKPALEFMDYRIADAKKKHSRPTDLEGLAAIPGRPGEFIALESTGCVLHLNLRASGRKLRRVGRLAHCEGWFKKHRDHDGARQCEALALHPAGKDLLLAWATRGHEKSASTIAWSRVTYANLIRPGPCDRDAKRRFASATTTFSAAAFIKKVERSPRHAQVLRAKPDDQERFFRNISDMTLDSRGTLYLTSAYDPGDKGPFAAGLWQAGQFTFPSGGGAPTFHADIRPLEIRGPVPQPCHKYEALTIAPDGRWFVLGSDDEDFGGCLRFHPVKPAPSNGAYLTNQIGR